MKKSTQYWWFMWSHNNADGGKTYIEDVTFRHPFFEMEEQRRHSPGIIANVTLHNWKEISPIEYDMFYKSLFRHTQHP